LQFLVAFLQFIPKFINFVLNSPIMAEITGLLNSSAGKKLISSISKK
jgi:hypothetical protein